MTHLIELAATLEAGPSAWDELWRKVLSDGEAMPAPSPRVVELADDLRRRGVVHVLDLGCGPGRHTVFLASRGFHIYATDVSAEAIEACRRALAEAGLRGEVSQEPMTELGLPNRLVEWVLAENVLYHGRRGDMRQAIAEAHRVLKPGGWIFATLISTGDEKLRWYREQASFGRAEEVEPNTYHALFHGPTDEHVPHTFVARDEIPALFEGFGEVEVCEDRSFDGKGEVAAYWQVLARKRSL